MWALALVLAGLPLQVETRPDGPVKVPLAQVTLGSGAVTISTGKTSFPAMVGFALGAGDTLVLGRDAWVTLALATNDQVVRLDDELTLKVEALAMLKAAKQTRSYKEQLDALVTPQEREGSLRLAGWHASPMAANVPQAGDGKAPDKKSEGPRKVVAREENQTKPGGPRPTGGKESEREDDAVVPPPPKRAPKDELSMTPKTMPPPPPPSAQPTPPAFALDAVLTACVDSELRALGPEVKRALGTSVAVKARRREGTVQVRFGVGLMTPACVTAWVAQHQVTEEWQSIVVPIK